MSRLTRRFMLVAGLLLLLVPAVFAATQNAVIYGTVYNAAGNPMPDVSVTLENPALGFSRTTATGSDGSYNFAEVPPADGYKVTARQGAKTLDIRAGITVNVGDERVILPPLTEQVQTATGPAEPVAPKVMSEGIRTETVSTSISGVVTGDQLRSLPLYNRNFLVLGLITPNVKDTEAGSELAGASFSVAGTRPSQNSFLLDGADNVASSSNQAVPFQVNDAIQEFRVISSTANAEYGRNLGGTVNVVTRRGGNAFHGSGYGYFGMDSLNAENHVSLYNGSTFDKAAAFAGPTTAVAVPSTSAEFFTPFTYNQYVANAEAGAGNPAFRFCTDGIGSAAGTPCTNGVSGLNTRFDPATLLAQHNRFKPSFDSKQFGINLGGPIAKDKLFFFASYEGTRIDNPNAVLERVPSSFDRTYDPFATGAFNFAPTDANYVLNQNILSLFPASNLNTIADGAVPGVLEFFQGEAPNYTNVDNILFRADYRRSEQTSFALRYAVQFLNQLHDATLPATGSYPGNGALRNAFNQNLSITFSRSLSSTAINELRFGFNRFDVSEEAQDIGFDASTLGMPVTALPTILLNGLDTQYSGQRPPGGTGFATAGAFTTWVDCCNMLPWADFRFPFARLGAPLGTPAGRRDTTWFVGDSISLSRGKHSFKFGVDFRKLDNNAFNGSFNRGMIYSSNIGEFTSDSESCHGLCNSAFAFPSFDFAQFNPTYSGHFDSYVVSGYFQDTFRIHPRVTLNMGLRYDYFSVPTEANDGIWNFDPRANGLVQQNGSSITDPYGYACGSPASWDSVPQVIQGFLGFGFVSDWQCQTSPTGAQNIARSDKNNVAPRFGMAIDMFGNGRTVLRGAVGWFYDQTPVSYTQQLMFNRPIPFSEHNGMLGQIGCPTPCAVSIGLGSSDILNRTFPGFSQFFSDVAQPFTTYARDVDHSATPFSRQISVSLQQRVHDKVGLEVGYVSTVAEDLPVIYDSNFVNEWSNVGFQGLLLSGDISRDLLRSNMQHFPVFTLTNQAESHYHSLMARARIQDFHGLRVNATYTWAKGLDNASNAVYPSLPIAPQNLLIGYQAFANGNLPAWCLLVTPIADPSRTPLCAKSVPLFPFIDFSSGAVTTTGAGQILVSRYNLPQNPLNFLVDDYGPSDFDVRHRVVIDYTWDVPSLSKAYGLPKWMDNWTLSGIFVAQTGQPFTIFSGPIAGAITQRGDIGGTVITDFSTPFNTIQSTDIILPQQSLLACPAAQLGLGTSTFLPRPGEPCIGHSGRNQWTGPDLISMNFAVQKGFQIFGEGRMLIMRAEFFNMFNRANYYNPISAASDNGFTPSGDFGTIKSAHEPRQIQLAVRFTW